MERMRLRWRQMERAGYLKVRPRGLMRFQNQAAAWPGRAQQDKAGFAIFSEIRVGRGLVHLALTQPRCAGQTPSLLADGRQPDPSSCGSKPNGFLPEALHYN
jgi:hypothetical protein